jgi:hypothetical protein
MALTNNPQNSNSLFSAANKQYNINQQSSEDFHDVIKSLNIVDPDLLNKEELSIILKRVDDYSGLFTTQQLENIDYHKFSNHVFFDSAVSKVSYSFDRIQNKPYDKDELENIKYHNKTDGYTQYLLKNIFPKSKGFARFSGKEKIVMYDQQGKILKDSDTKKIGVLNPLNNRFSIDFWINVNSSNFVNNQIVFKKLDNTNNKQNGFICYISEGDTANNCYINFLMFSSGFSASSKCLISKDLWQNIVISVSHTKGNKKTSFIIDGNIVEESNVVNSDKQLSAKSFGEGFRKINIPLVLGGIFIIEDDLSIVSTLTLNNITFNNFNGDIDEFRLFHRVRSVKTIKKEMHKNIYAQKGLKIYLRLNEPAGNYQNSCLVIDYSGNKLHGLIYKKDDANSSHYILNDTTGAKINENTPLSLEKDIDSPVLNSSYSSIVNIREKLISLAAKYDNQNPNLIFNLLPKHYFLNSSDLQNLPVFSNNNEYKIPSSIIKENGNISDPTTLTPTNPANTDLVNIVLIWARFFDQLKMHIGSITNFLNVDYDSINQNKVVGMQIPILCKMYGIKFKELLPAATKLKLDNENLNYKDIISDISIRKIQNILWQRFLINTQDILRSKGTVNSIKSTFRSFGVDYTKFIDIKEHSSYNTINKDNNYSLSNFKKYAANFGNKNELTGTPEYTDEAINDFSNNKLYLAIPNIKSQTQKTANITESAISGFDLNWSIETFFKFNDVISQNSLTNKTQVYKPKQCVLRLETDDSPTLIATYEKYSYSDLGKLTVSIYPIKNNNSYVKDIDILGINLFDLPKYLCISQSADLNASELKYTVLIDDIGKQINIKDKKSKSSTVNVAGLTALADAGNLSFYKNNTNFSIGNYNYTGNQYLTTTLATKDDTSFQGEIFKVRFWNKRLSEVEMTSHAENIDNIGVISKEPLKNLISDFEINDASNVTNNNVKSWSVPDISNNMIKNTNTNEYEPLNTCSIFSRNSLQSDNDIIVSQEIICKVKNIKIDEPNISNRVNVISYKDDSNKNLAKKHNRFPSNDTPISFNYDNVTRISIDMSIAKIINNDISNIIANIDDFTSEISNSHSLHAYSYKNLETLRDKYFEKYSDENLIDYASVGNIFKYFDNIMSSILYDIVPSSVRFEGFNYVYESHVLERHKYEHKNYNSTISISDIDNYASYSRETSANRRNIVFNNNRKLINT